MTFREPIIEWNPKLRGRYAECIEDSRWKPNSGIEKRMLVRIAENDRHECVKVELITGKHRGTDFWMGFKSLFQCFVLVDKPQDILKEVSVGDMVGVTVPYGAGSNPMSERAEVKSIDDDIAHLVVELGSGYQVVVDAPISKIYLDLGSWQLLQEE